jgi:hypothetical protein
VQEVEERITGRSLVSECILYVPDYSNMGKKSKKNKQTKVVIAKRSKEPEISSLCSSSSFCGLPVANAPGCTTA